MHVAHITSHFASLDYMEVIRARAIRSLFATRLSHRCNRGARSREEEEPHRWRSVRLDDMQDVMEVTSARSHRLAVDRHLAAFADFDLERVDRLAIGALLARRIGLQHLDGLHRLL